jgi:hypothetical protein
VLQDDGDIVAEAIRNRTAIAVSDGSFKDTYGTAAWVLEGDSSDGRIVGRVIAPGNDVDHSAYRSELSGILAVMIMVKHICEHHKIKEGAVELACDGLSAIDKAFSYVSLLHIDEPDFDLIAAIKHQWRYSPILWKVRHVRGHQDKHTAINNLDRWSRLNVEMDQLAKAYIEVAKVRPRHFSISGEPWSIWIENKKITKDIASTIYEIAHVDQIKQYWINKDKVSAEKFSAINWKAIGKAMEQSTRSRRVFISKHTVGMCGVGKFMHRWKQRDSPNCPRCGQFEDASHVWLCSGSNSSEIWEKSLEDLEAWMSSVSTDPDIQDAILHHLKDWRNGNVEFREYAHDLRDLIQEQSNIGWQNFFEGWIPSGWEEAQHAFYTLIRSHRTGRRWTICLIKKLWNVAWDMWEHRNGVLHQQDNSVTMAEIIHLDRKVRSLHFQLKNASISTQDKYLLSISLEMLLAKDSIYKNTWLSQAQVALAVYRRMDWANSARAMLRNMRRVLYRWLQQG